MRLRYYFQKIIKAHASGTLTERTIRFLWVKIYTPILILVGYFSLSKSDRRLNLRDGFRDHRYESYHHKSKLEHIQRIIKAYKESKKYQLSASQDFAIQGLWDEWIKVNYQYLINALETEDKSILSSIFENLFRESCTIGIGGYDDWIRYRSLLGNLYLKYVWCNYQKKLLSLDYKQNELNFPNIGNPTGVLTNEKIIPIETLRHAYHAASISELFRKCNNLIFVEIGGGRWSSVPNIKDVWP